MQTFRQLLPELVANYGGSKQDLAKAVGISPSTLSHLLSDQATHVPSTDVCLQLAHVTGTSASKVLRAAGRGDVADMLEDLYGQAATRRQPFREIRLTPHEEKHLVTVRALAPKTQRAYFVIVEAAATHKKTGKTLEFSDGRERVKR